MKNLTKLFCDLISFGTQLSNNSVPDEQVIGSLAQLHNELVPDDCFTKIDEVIEHVEALRVALRGADFDIDNVRNRLAQGKPVSIQRIVEFHNKLTVKLNDGQELTFNATDVVRY